MILFAAIASVVKFNHLCIHQAKEFPSKFYLVTFTQLTFSNLHIHSVILFGDWSHNLFSKTMLCLTEQFDFLPKGISSVFQQGMMVRSTMLLFPERPRYPKTIHVDPLESGLDTLTHKGLKVSQCLKRIVLGGTWLSHSIVNYMNVCSFHLCIFLSLFLSLSLLNSLLR